MADDIVTRLRKHEKHWSQGHEGKTDCERGLCSQCQAADEIIKLKSLISELLPYMLHDIEQALYMGPPPLDHIEDDPCEDCQWFENANSWKKRIETGEFKDYK